MAQRHKPIHSRFFAPITITITHCFMAARNKRQRTFDAFEEITDVDLLDNPNNGDIGQATQGEPEVTGESQASSLTPSQSASQVSTQPSSLPEDSVSKKGWLRYGRLVGADGETHEGKMGQTHFKCAYCGYVRTGLLMHSLSVTEYAKILIQETHWAPKEQHHCFPQTPCATPPWCFGWSSNGT